MHLEPFVLTAELASFSGAARSLGVTPAAVSKAVSRLEASLGVQLLERTSRRVSLTDEGALFLQHARTALDAMQRGREAIAARRAHVAGRVRVSASPVLGSRVMTALSAISAAHPDLDLQCRFTDARADLGDEADIAIRVGALEDSSLLARRIHVARWVIVASPDYLATVPPIRTPHDLRTVRCVSFIGPDGRAVRWTLPADLADSLDVRMHVDEGNALLAAAEAGVGVAQVFQGVASEALAAGRLVQLLPEWMPEGPPVHLLYPSTTRSLPRMRVVIDALTTGLFPA